MLPNNVKVTVEINEGIATATIDKCPPGVNVEVDTKDYDTEGTDFNGLVEGDDFGYDQANGGIVYLIGSGASHDSTGQLVTALAAIVARIQGEFDHPALAAFGPLGTDTLADVLAIARHEYQHAPLLSVDQLSSGLRRLPVAACIMQPGDVLSAFDLGEHDTEEQGNERLALAAEWLAENRKHVDEAMTRNGFNAIEVLASAKDFTIASDAGPWGIWWLEKESWKTDDNATVHEFTSADAAESFIESDLRSEVMAGCSFEVRRLENECIPFKDYGKETDVAGHIWPADYLVCSVCGQPDSCGDCDHTPLTDDEAKSLLGERE